MLRAKVQVDLKAKKLVDAFQIFRKNEPRNLTAAYKFYCGKNLDDAHSAQADTMATYEVLLAQLERYPDVPDTVAELDAYTRGEQQYADFAGRIAYDKDGVEVFNFGKHKGLRVRDVFRRDPSYYAWLMNTDFPAYTKQVFTRIYAS
jgi:DNA polymerase-3 subunit epsilon